VKSSLENLICEMLCARSLYGVSLRKEFLDGDMFYECWDGDILGVEEGDQPPKERA
jgi:hypothetical protein